ncbi:hypothetical protein EDC04DRAFT_3094687 [Pisolithus marmoratus]|nr:hypothetical protein EDC04DRAFT_3094687 [Pisolithus marmoratus]
MPTRPTHLSQKENQIGTRTHSHLRPNAIQHGEQRQHQDYHSFLLELPVESLTHVTSYLTPLSLVALGRTCKRLRDHVEDDNTWYRAFLTQVVGVHPEHPLDEGNLFLLRRVERTWREEFVSRYTLRQQWEHSCTPCITHTPQDTTIDSIHLVSPYIQPSPLSRPPRSNQRDQLTGPGPALLTTSIQYGTISRSFPLTGKVLKGYLDPSGTGPGIGNPNAEFTPDVSACEIMPSSTSESKGSVSVVWGKRNGEILLTTTNRAFVPGSGLATSRVVRCNAQDMHHGIVNKIVVDSLSNTFLSAGGDGRVKLWDWDQRTLNCVWTSEQNQVSLVPDGVVGLAGGLSSGVIVGALASGDVCVWWVPSTVDVGPAPTAFPELRIGDPTKGDEDQGRDLSGAGHTASRLKPKLSAIHILRGPPSSPTLPDYLLLPPVSSSHSTSFLMSYTSHPFLYLLTIPSAGTCGITRFGDEECGCSLSAFEVVGSTVEPICSFWTATSKEGCRGGMRERRFVIVGDQMGFVSFYDIDTLLTPPASTHTPISSPTSITPATLLHVSTPKHKFAAHSDGSITSIAWSPYMFATGSQRGSIAVWDSITLEVVRRLDSLQFSHRPLRFPLHLPPALDPGDGGMNEGGERTDAEREGDVVSKILIEKQMVVAVRGNKVMTWKSSDTGRLGKARRRARGKKVCQGRRMEGGVAKGLDHYDFQMSITDSISEIVHERECAAYERERMTRIIERVREEREGMENLGLDETEAIRYVMWLSREEYVKEVEERIGTETGEESYEGNPDYLHGDAPTPDMEATSERTSSSAEEEFPPIPQRNPSGSSTTSNSSPSTSVSASTSGSVWGSAPAWGSLMPSSGRERCQSLIAQGNSQVSPSSGAGASSMASGWGNDDDLRFAIELSLVEAKSRGDVV